MATFTYTLRPFINVEIVMHLKMFRIMNKHSNLSSDIYVIFCFFPDYIFEDLSKGYNFLKAFIDNVLKKKKVLSK